LTVEYVFMAGNMRENINIRQLRTKKNNVTSMCNHP
jgi:hypothetical protein